MSEKCLLAASVALLVCHPRTSINCFNSKQPTNPTNQKSSHHTSNPDDGDQEQNQSKSKKLRDHFDESDDSDSSTRSKLDIPSPLVVRAFNPQMADSISISISLLVQGQNLFEDVKNSFVQGWESMLGLNIDNIYMVNHGFEARSEFEEYRETVKFRAGKSKTSKKKLIGDGNEFLGFHSAIVTCSFGVNGVSSFCDKKDCGFCSMMYSDKKKNVWFNDNSWRAHQKLTAESVGNAVQGRKAIVMCRVIAGRIGRYQELRQLKEGYDSAIRSVDQDSYNGEELMVLNPRAILPSFIVIYSVK